MKSGTYMPVSTSPPNWVSVVSLIIFCGSRLTRPHSVIGRRLRLRNESLNRPWRQRSNAAWSPGAAAGQSIDSSAASSSAKRSTCGRCADGSKSTGAANVDAAKSAARAASRFLVRCVCMARAILDRKSHAESRQVFENYAWRGFLTSIDARLTLQNQNSGMGTRLVAHGDELPSEADDLVQILARLRIGQARAELLVDGGRLEPVDVVHRVGLAAAVEGTQYVPRAGVIRGDDAILAGDRVADGLQLVEQQHAQIRRAELDVVVGIEQFILGQHAVAATRPPRRFPSPAGGDELHEAIGRGRAHRERIEVALGADDGEDQTRADLVLSCGFRDHRAEFLRLLVGEIRDHRDLYVKRVLGTRIGSDRPVGRAADQVIGERLGIGR